jgi:hypothetical protein
MDDFDRSLTMLDRTGDTTITWTSDQDDAMEALIAAKMKAGVTFFILPQRKSNRGAAPKPKPFTSFDDAKKHRALSIPDVDFSKFVLEGKGTAIPTPSSVAEGKAKGVRVSTSPKEVAKSRSIGVQQRVGG